MSERLWRCVKCGKWSHAVRRPKGHERGTVDPKLGEVVTRNESGYHSGTEEYRDYYFVECGPFEPWCVAPGAAGPYSIGSGHWPGVSKLVEELGELGQVLGKLIAINGSASHWDGSDLRVRLVEEMGDVRAAISFFSQQNLTPEEAIRLASREADKLQTFHDWHTDQVDPKEGA